MFEDIPGPGPLNLNEEQHHNLNGLFNAMRSWDRRRILKWVIEIFEDDESMQPTISQLSEKKDLNGRDLAKTFRQTFFQEMSHIKSPENSKSEGKPEDVVEKSSCCSEDTKDSSERSRQRSTTQDPYVSLPSAAICRLSERPTSRPAGKERSTPRPAANQRSRSRPTSQERSRSRPTSQERSRSRPKSQEQSRSRPTSQERSRSQPKSHERSTSRPAGKERSTPRPAANQRSRSRLASKERSRSRPASQERSRSRPASKERSRPRPPSQERSIPRPPSQERSIPRPPSQERSRSRSASKERSRPRSPSQERSKSRPPSQKRLKLLPAKVAKPVVASPPAKVAKHVVANPPAKVAQPVVANPPAQVAHSVETVISYRPAHIPNLMDLPIRCVRPEIAQNKAKRKVMPRRPPLLPTPNFQRPVIPPTYNIPTLSSSHNYYNSRPIFNSFTNFQESPIYQHPISTPNAEPPCMQYFDQPQW